MGYDEASRADTVYRERGRLKAPRPAPRQPLSSLRAKSAAVRLRYRAHEIRLASALKAAIRVVPRGMFFPAPVFGGGVYLFLEVSMKNFGLNELREMYLSFFETKGHLRLPSFSLIPRNDPSLLLINAGMSPMKTWFTGEEEPPRRRAEPAAEGAGRAADLCCAGRGLCPG